MGYVLNRGTKDRPSWYCKYKDSDGKWKQKATKQPSRALALRYVAEIEGRVARGLIGMPEQSDEKQHQAAITIGELADRFLAEYNPPRLRDRHKYMLQAKSSFAQRLLSYPIAKLPAASVRVVDVMRYRDALRTDEYEAATINNALRRLSLLFNWGYQIELVTCKNPVSRVERMPAPPSEEHYTLAQVQALLTPEHRSPMIATALYTGMRRGELCGLTWQHVHFEQQIIEVKRSFAGPTKSGKPRVVPIHRELLPILRDWQAQCPDTPERLVFPVLRGGRYQMRREINMVEVRGILAAAGCPDDLERPWHAMRRSFATLFAASGGAREALEQILGHTTSGNKITAIYVLPSVDYLARELAKMSLQPGQPGKVYSLADYLPRAS